MPASIGCDLPRLGAIVQAVLFEYDLLAGSPSNRGRWGANRDDRVPTALENETTTKAKKAGSFQPLSLSGENLIDEITGLLGKTRSAAGLNDNSLQNKGRSLIADLKNKMGVSGPSETPHPKQTKPFQSPQNAQSSDPAEKYREKVRCDGATDISLGGGAFEHRCRYAMFLWQCRTGTNTSV